MDPKPQPNHARYIQILRSMTGEQKLLKAFELTEVGRERFSAGLRKDYPHLPDDDLKKLVRLFWVASSGTTEKEYPDAPGVYEIQRPRLEDPSLDKLAGALGVSVFLKRLRDEARPVG